MANRRGLLWGLVAGLLLGGGVAAIAFSVLQGGAKAGVFVVFPFVIGSSPLLAVGVVLLFVGFLALSLVGLADSAAAEERRAPARGTGASPVSGNAPSGSSTSYGGFLLIGPVPVVFGNRPGWLPYLVALALATVIAVLAFALLLRP